MTVSVLKTHEAVRDIAPEWTALLRRSHRREFFMTPEWFFCSFSAFHRLDRPYIIVVRQDNGTLQAIAPLVITRRLYRGIPLDRIGFPANEQNPANDFIIAGDGFESCLTEIMEHLCQFREWNFIELKMIEEASPVAEFLNSFLKESKSLYGIKPNRVSPYIDLQGDWDSFWSQKSKRFKKSMRNKLNHAQRFGYEVHKTPIPDKEAPQMGDMLRVSTNSWKREQGTDLGSRQDNWAFYQALCQDLGQGGQVFLWTLKVDNAVVAFEFHVENEGTVYPLRADYDESYKDLSPGSILEYEILRRLFGEEKIKEYNSCGHTYKYLLNWTGSARAYVNYEIFNSQMLSIALYKFEYALLDNLRKMQSYQYVKRIIRG